MAKGRKPKPIADRFWPKVNKCGPVPLARSDLGQCWLWQASLDGNGYGHMRTGSQIDGTRRLQSAHILSYEMLVGQVPKGLDLDHLCRVRKCVNPAHLEPVTRKENVRRGIMVAVNTARQRAKTHCPHGHPYSGTNLYVARNGDRHCNACMRARDRAARRTG